MTSYHFTKKCVTVGGWLIALVLTIFKIETLISFEETIYIFKLYNILFNCRTDYMFTVFCKVDQLKKGGWTISLLLSDIWLVPKKVALYNCDDSQGGMRLFEKRLASYLNSLVPSFHLVQFMLKALPLRWDRIGNTSSGLMPKHLIYTEQTITPHCVKGTAKSRKITPVDCWSYSVLQISYMSSPLSK